MPVHIDHIDTEIEVSPREKAAQSQPSAKPDPTSRAVMDLKASVLAVLEAELDAYLRMRG